ncbi:MAG TPA: NAD(P)-dependent oxidoreductase [Candidatus Acidoferrales bacterium]|nr:NAD(P)-dependent oxidoreductase [Candidatus Acidoferrales bacterium]
MKIGFVGLGNMGEGMARNLLRAGHRLAAYNRTRAKAEALAPDGARIAASPADACRDAEAVFTMLSDDAAVESAVFGSDGIAGALPPAAAHISSSTISTAIARRLADEHSKRGQGFLSAPVFGRPDAAASARLVVVAAGPSALVDRFQPLFAAIGRQTFVAGDQPWQANALKLCGNFMIGSMIETFGEAVACLRKAGVDPHVFLDAMTALFGSPVYANYGRLIVNEQFDPAGFALRLGLKDIRLVLETSQECAAPMPIASLVRDHLLSGVASGQANLDWSSIARVSARNAGL